MMVEKEINLVIEKNRGLGKAVCISTEAAARIGVQTGDMIRMHPPGKEINADLAVRVSDTVYPFLLQIDPDVLDSLKIKSLNVSVSRSTYKPSSAMPAPPQASFTASKPETRPLPTLPQDNMQPVREASIEPVPTNMPGSQSWILVPNQVDGYQQLVVDEHGTPRFGLDTDGYPLDSRGNSFTSANYYNLSTKETVAAAESAPELQPASQKMQMVAPNQVDEFGVQITDSRGNPVYGMDASGWYAIDSAGKPWSQTSWVDMDDAQQAAGSQFNAVLVLDISRSMLARDLDVLNIDSTIRGIKRSMKSSKIQYFLNQFKEGTLVPRRMAAALATITFLAEKMSRCTDEKVAVIRFADMAETLDFDGAAFTDGERNAQDMFEKTAVSIVDNIGNSYGQATEMGKALYMALELVKLMGDMEVAAGGAVKPVMCLLLTDGFPTDEASFASAVEAASNIPNLTLHFIGLGTPNKELMARAAESCGGEFFMPADTGQLLAWYAEKATSFKPRRLAMLKKSDGDM